METVWCHSALLTTSLQVGGTTRVSGFLLALSSFGVLIAGPGVIGYLPVCVVGALIFILGLDLVKEVSTACLRSAVLWLTSLPQAVWDTYGRVNRFEYITIWAIIIVRIPHLPFQSLN